MKTTTPKVVVFVLIFICFNSVDFKSFGREVIIVLCVKIILFIFAVMKVKRELFKAKSCRRKGFE